jgi:hypothetical protein
MLRRTRGVRKNYRVMNDPFLDDGNNVVDVHGVSTPSTSNTIIHPHKRQRRLKGMCAIEQSFYNVD